MRYIASRPYKKHDKANNLLWKCSKGDKIDVEKVGNINTVKLINQTQTNSSLLNYIFMKIHDYEEFKEEHLTEY